MLLKALFALGVGIITYIIVIILAAILHSLELVKIGDLAERLALLIACLAALWYFFLSGNRRG